MRKINIHYYCIIFSLVVVLMLSSCQQPGGNSTGSEFMPDMAHSIAYEANVNTYYYNNTWGSRDEYYEMAKNRKPVKGTIPRGYAGGNQVSDYAGIRYTANGSVPYDYEDTEEDRTRAIAEIIDNPFPITNKGLESAKELYDIYCGICHGEKGDGLGYLVREADPAKGITAGVYPVQPANLLLDEFVNASNGRYYHTIMHGRNLMGAYNDKLNYEERWQVIHYIRSLQATSLGLEYNQFSNTLNSVDQPAGEVIEVVEVEEAADHGEHMPDDHDHGDHHEDDHNHDEH